MKAVDSRQWTVDSEGKAKKEVGSRQSAEGGEEKAKRGWWRRVFWFQLFSPKGFLICAGTLAVLFGAVHLAGWRDYTSILCGQAPTGDMADRTAIHLGMAYVVFHLGCVLVAPVLAIAAGIFAALQRVAARRGPGDRAR